MLMIYEMNHMKWNEMKKWSLQLMQFMQLHREAWKKNWNGNGIIALIPKNSVSAIAIVTAGDCLSQADSYDQSSR